MMSIIHDAGAGVYPVLLFGAAMLATACVFAIVPNPRFLPLLAAFLASTLMSGAMGTLRGVQHTATVASESGSSRSFFQGLPDDLLCLQVALGFSFVAMLLTMIGAARFAAHGSPPPQHPKGGTRG